MSRTLLCLVVSLSILTAWKYSAANHPNWEPVSAAELAEDKPKIEPEAAAEILSYRLEIDDSNIGFRNTVSQIRYKIFDPSRAADVTRIDRYWIGQTNPNYEIRARLTLPDGTVQEFDHNDLRERNEVEGGRANGLLGSFVAHSDFHVEEHFLAITGVVKGAVLDVWESEPRTVRRDWSMSSIQRNDIPIRNFDYTSRYFHNTTAQHRVFVLNPNGGKVTDDTKNHLMNFHAENLPSISAEPMAAPAPYFSLTIIETYETFLTDLRYRTHKIPKPKTVPASLGPWAYFSTGLDYYDAEMGDITNAIRAKAAELTAGAPTDKEKAKRIYNFVQSSYQRFRKRIEIEHVYSDYIISIETLLDPTKIDSGLISKDDFYYFYVALARAAGLECHSIYHPNRTEFRFRIDLVSEAFVKSRSLGIKLDDRWILCDPCTEVPLAFGELPWEIENQPALLALPQQQAFLNVPSPPAESCALSALADLTLDRDGNLEGECTWTFTGHQAADVRIRLNSIGQERWPELAPELVHRKNSLNDFRLLRIEDVDSPEKPVRIRAHLRWNTYASPLDGGLIFAPAVLAEGQPPLLTESKRTTPVFFLYPAAEIDSLTIHLPSGFSPKSVPKPIVAQNGAFGYTLSVKLDRERHSLQVERQTINRAVEISVADYPKASDWFRREATADGISLILSHDEMLTPPNPITSQN